ncbi:hypothetical protein HPP92_026997 [Vanilla planifolia]|uniref:WRKY19-like zinc finger domain-containing protein n=1 Tax=Vanilla planifolia TaxID=51239 RepID=A0A835PEF6_VANPL|nr:hypothetical protein HPP92_026997 [Vanilla planifolia]
MDLSMTEMLLHKPHLISSSCTEATHMPNWRRYDTVGDNALSLDCLGYGTNTNTRASCSESNADLSGRDDGCKLVLGLGPTSAIYSADCSTRLVKPEGPLACLQKPLYEVDSGMLQLGLTGSYTEVVSEQMQSSSNQNSLTLIVDDEGSTSARKSGRFLPSLLFAPMPESNCSHRDFGETTQLEHSPEPSGMSECSLATRSSFQRTSHHHPPKKCRFNECSKKGARGLQDYALLMVEVRGVKNLAATRVPESRTAYCKAHGGGRRCHFLGCTKSAEGKTDYCIAHGGGKRCVYLGCSKAARGKSGLCIRHGGGKRCTVEGCTRSAEGQAGLCISHGGGRRCQFVGGCNKGAQGSTMYCKAHGGGRRCVFEGCNKGAEGSTPLCKAHGGGRRCLYEGGGVCPKSVHGGTDYCVAHGGGKRCAVSGCTRSARGRTDCCVRHGGGKRCQYEGCGKSAQGSTNYCKAHGGGKRCTWNGGCEKFARGKSGLCAAHGNATVGSPMVGGGGGMIGPGLFEGIVSATTAADSSSGLSIVSDCGGAESSDSFGRSRSLALRCSSVHLR